MRLPHMRFTVRRMMLAIAVAASLLWWAISRPYPWLVTTGGFVRWSDGSETIVTGKRALKFRKFRGNSWVSIVDWPDGSTGYYLKLRQPNTEWTKSFAPTR